MNKNAVEIPRQYILACLFVKLFLYLKQKLEIYVWGYKCKENCL